MLALYPRSFARDASIIPQKLVTNAPTVFDVLQSVLDSKERNAGVLKLRGNGLAPEEYLSLLVFYALR
jgi:hypothetical protein